MRKVDLHMILFEPKYVFRTSERPRQWLLRMLHRLGL